MTRFASSPAFALFAALAAAVWASLAVPAPLAAQQQPAQPQKPAAQAPDAAKPQPDTQEQRLRQLEDQMLDLQAMVGALQSLASGAAPSAKPDATAPTAPPGPGQQPPGGGDLAQRIDVIETQIRALAGQMGEITSQLARIHAALGNGQRPDQPDAAPPPEATQPQGQQPPGAQPAAPEPPPQTFGKVTVQPEQQPAPPQSPPQAQPLPQQPYPPQAQPVPPSQQPGQAPAARQPQAPAAAPPDPQTLAIYETAYNHLLRRDFKSAEEGFRAFIKAHPDDPLAGNAQYWLGETYFVRGKYREAAKTFLAGYRRYRNSDKAPANLLKLGMSLSQLGQKDAACATFSELAEKFPAAPAQLKQRAASERRRAGC